MRLLAHMLTRFVQNGTLRVIDANGKLHVFSGSPEPVVTLRLSDKALHHKLFFNPELYAGEAYMDGTLTFEDCELYDFLLLFAMNRVSLGSYPLQSTLRRIWKLLRTVQQHNPAARAKTNVAHHYDLSGDLYQLFMDDDLQYSCAYFLSEDDSLEQAQQNKKCHIAAKLLIEPGQKILDIGSGWGGLALYLATLADVQVTGVTLSKEQYDVATRRAEALGLAGRVRFELRDYREIEGSFDRIVSVGMFEHVGIGHYDSFFAKIKALLTEDGVALLHSIGHRSPPGTTSPWLRKYIFPGAYAPALSEVLAAVERQYLWVTDMEILRLHYADTLRAWRSRFEANRAKIAALYDERFCRMWEFYLVSAEMTFRHGSAMVFQMQLARQADAAPLTRGYIAEAAGAYLGPGKAAPQAAAQIQEF